MRHLVWRANVPRTVANNAAIGPGLLFAALNTPVVKRHIRAKQFTQDVIDTIGKGAHAGGAIAPVIIATASDML